MLHSPRYRRHRLQLLSGVGFSAYVCRDWLLAPPPSMWFKR